MTPNHICQLHVILCAQVQTILYVVHFTAQKFLLHIKIINTCIVHVQSLIINLELALKLFIMGMPYGQKRISLS